MHAVEAISSATVKKLFCLPLLLFFAFLPLDSYAQFGPHAEEGFGVGGGYSSADNSSTISVSTGYVFQPALEVGVGVGRNSSDNADLTATGVGPYVSVYPVRQGEDFPFSIVLSGSYSFQTFSGNQVDRLESQGGSISGNSFSLGSGLFHAFDVNESLDILPFAGVNYARNKTEVSGGGQTASNTEGTTSLALSLSFEFKTSGSSSFVVTPSTNIGDENSSLGISASFVIPSAPDQ
jgi:hypothetical protein